MHTFESEYQAFDESNPPVVSVALTEEEAEEGQSGEDRFFTSLEALIEFGTGALVVVR